MAMNPTIANNTGSTTDSVTAAAPQQLNIPNFNVREVYKAGWVRRTSVADKKGGPFGKRYDRLWALFCVHDDVQPFLEFYSDPKASASHQPVWMTSLIQCQHISPSIIIQGDTYEFVVTLTTIVLRLGTATREQMNEWVEVLRNRLRDIGVLEPKENLYSRMPETKLHLGPVSTHRDPNSPLPLPPPVANQFPLERVEPASVDRAEPDDLYAATEPNLSETGLEMTPIAVTSIEDVEEDAGTRVFVSDHVTVISVNHDMDDPFDDAVTEISTSPGTAFATRLRIASAPCSLQETPEHNRTNNGTEENSYEAIFVTPSAANNPSRTLHRTYTTDGQFHSIPAESTRNEPHSNALNNGSEHPEVVLRSTSQSVRRDALRRTVSVGPELQMTPSNPAGHVPPNPPRPLAIIRPVSGNGTSRDRRRDGPLLANPILLPRNGVVPPPLFVAPAPLVGPLATRMNSPPFRPPAPSSALQPVSSNQGPAEMGYSLKERQVARLRMEMQHPAGVRILLKKKDCLNTIALIDALGWTWVGGWRQKEKPLLYNVFHIGDQIMRVGHCNVSSAAEVHRLIKSETGSQIEFIVRRVPFGRVFHLLRESEGQSVGIVTEGSTAEIREVVPGGIAALAGLSPLAVSPLSSSFCTWTLTEINGRPLNLCSKEGEARDRLNAVGKAITVLVQPTDFVKALKKQLKSLRGYKDYLLG